MNYEVDYNEERFDKGTEYYCQLAIEKKKITILLHTLEPTKHLHHIKSISIYISVVIARMTEYNEESVRNEKNMQYYCQLEIEKKKAIILQF